MRTSAITLALAALVTLGAGCFSSTSVDVEADLPAVEVDAGADAAAGTQPEGTPAVNDTPESDINVDGEAMVDVSVGSVKEFTVIADNFAFDLKEMRVKKGDTVRVTFRNAEGFHDWVLDEFDAKTAQLQAGGEETVEFVADETGTFEYYCSVGKHRSMGMVGNLIVE